MGRVYLEFDKKKNKWKEVEHSNFYLNRRLYEKLNSLKMIQRKNWDGVIIVDGKERSGKSILGMVMGWYLSKCKIGIDNFARGVDDAAEKISKLPDRSVLIMDEGSTVFGSRDASSKVQKQLIKVMDVVGQKNLIFIVCLPCFFDLNKTIAVRRSLFLCHVYPDDRYNRGQFAFWGENKKKWLYILGKKNYDSYAQPDADFTGQYPDFKPPFYEDYINKVKKESLDAVIKEAVGNKKDGDAMVRETEELFYGYMKDVLKFKYRDLLDIRGQPQSTIKSRVEEYRRKTKKKP